MSFPTLIGSIGVSLLLVAFVLLQARKLYIYDLNYALLNFVGAALAMWSSYLIDFMPFVILEGVWALVPLRRLIGKVVFPAEVIKKEGRCSER